jgi:hypothetical protein
VQFFVKAFLDPEILAFRHPDFCHVERWRFEIVDMDGKKIDRVLASPIVEYRRREDWGVWLRSRLLFSATGAL